MEWRFIPEERLGGAAAMAFDEVAAETVAAGGPATVRLYRWTPSTVTLGYGTDASALDDERVREHGIDVTRRPTGGGAIYHDHTDDVAYSIIAPTADFPGDVTESYRLLIEPVLEAFEAVGAEVSFAPEPTEPLWEPMCYLRGLDPAHDLVAPDGRKIAGNAQYRTREAIVQHGSLSFGSDPEMRLAPYADPPVSTATFEERVCGLTDVVSVDRSAFVETLSSSLSSWVGAEEGAWTDAERDRAAELCELKYDADAWVHDRVDPT